MSVETLIAATEASAASAATPAPSPSATPEVKPAETPAAVPPAEETPKVQPSEAEPQTEETEPNIEEAPETSGDFQKYKPLFKENPELRNIIGREKAFSELGNFSDVKAIVERIPTVEDAETLTSRAENHQTMGQTFREDRTAFVESLKESDPLAFQAFATELPDILAATDEKLYTEQARIYANRVMSNTLAIAQQSGDAKFLEAAQLVAQFLGIQYTAAGQTARPDNSEAARLRKQLAERDQSDASQAFESFWNSTDEAIIGGCIAEIDKSLKEKLPMASPDDMARMKKEVWAKTLELLNAQPQFRSQIDNFRTRAQKGRLGIADHNEIVAFGTKRGREAIPRALKPVLDYWSKRILQSNQTEIDKKKAIAASTKDVGTGPQGTTSAAAPSTTGNGKPRGMSSIFSEIEAGTYTKR